MAFVSHITAFHVMFPYGSKGCEAMVHPDHETDPQHVSSDLPFCFFHPWKGIEYRYIPTVYTP